MDAGAGIEDSAASKRTFFRLTTNGGIVAARGQPEGEAAIGAVLRAPDESIVGTIGKRIGWQKDHHVAEYRALIEGLKLAQTHGIHHIRVFADSALVVGQVNGDSSVKAEHLRPLCNQATGLGRISTGWLAKATAIAYRRKSWGDRA
jgi:ribonuclease HI